MPFEFRPSAHLCCFRLSFFVVLHTPTPHPHTQALLSSHMLSPRPTRLLLLAFSPFSCASNPADNMPDRDRLQTFRPLRPLYRNFTAEWERRKNNWNVQDDFLLIHCCFDHMHIRYWQEDVVSYWYDGCSFIDYISKLLPFFLRLTGAVHAKLWRCTMHLLKSFDTLTDVRSQFSSREHPWLSSPYSTERLVNVKTMQDQAKSDSAPHWGPESVHLEHGGLTL